MSEPVEIREFGGHALVALSVLSLDAVAVATAVDGERTACRYPTVLQAVARFNAAAEELAARYGGPPGLLDPFDVCLAAADRSAARARGAHV
jgi:hypothetical protein